MRVLSISGEFSGPRARVGAAATGKADPGPIGAVQAPRHDVEISLHRFLVRLTALVVGAAATGMAIGWLADDLKPAARPFE
ncbi:hypothetical protein GCM10022221_60190 [Actinocorallia aurea]